jgi:oxaloacetate decarboxylase alpha subunit
MGVDSICIKDMASLLTPYTAYDLVRALKSNVKVPIQLHTHYTSGLAGMAELKAVEAGVDMLDTAMSPLALGTSHPATEAIVAALKETPYDTELDLEKLDRVRDYVIVLRDKYIKNGLLDPSLLTVDPKALIYQVPGGMLSNLKSQLTQAGKADLMPKVLEEVPRVRKDAGMPPLVTPTSQIVGTQAVFNVMAEERYQTVTKEFKALVKGEYGQTPVPISADFKKLIVGDDKIVVCRPADLLSDEMDRFRTELPLELVEQEEDVLSFAQFGDTAIKFFERRRDRKYGIDSDHADHENRVHPVA